MRCGPRLGWARCVAWSVAGKAPGSTALADPPRDGDYRHTERLGNFLFAERADEAQLDDSRRTRIGTLESRQRLLQDQNVFTRRGRSPAVDRREVYTLLDAAAFVGAAGTRVIDEDAAHHVRGDREKVGPVGV